MTTSQRWKTLVCFVLIHAAALSGAAVEIRLKPHVNSQGSVVLLGDIADVKESEAKTVGRSRDPLTGVAALARIELFPAPGASRSRIVKRREIRELLGLNGISLKEVRFTGAKSVVIQTGEQSRLRHVALASKATIIRDNPGFADAKPIATAGPQAATLETELVLAPVRNVRRGEIIRQANVTLVPVPVSGKGSAAALGIRPAIHTEDVIGMEATRALAADQPLDLRTLQRPLAVRRSDLVAVTSKAPGVRVETVARAVENATLGDLVLLESLVNRKKYTARVTGNKTAEVYASGIQVSSPRQAIGTEPTPRQRRTAP